MKTAYKCGAAAVLGVCVVANAFPDENWKYHNNFKNNTGQRAWDFHIQTVDGGNGIVSVRGGELIGPEGGPNTQRNWGSDQQGGAASSSGNLTAGTGCVGVADGRRLGLSVEHTMGLGGLTFDWWWTDQNHGRIGDINRLALDTRGQSIQQNGWTDVEWILTNNSAQDLQIDRFICGIAAPGLTDLVNDPGGLGQGSTALLDAGGFTLPAGISMNLSMSVTDPTVQYGLYVHYAGDPVSD